MRAQIERAMRRPWRYWYEDGLAEMAMGVVFAALGLKFLVESRLLPRPALTLLSTVGPMVAVLGAGWLAGRAVTALKARLTYPRTGYVAYRQRTGSRKAQSFALAAAISALVASLAALPSLRVWIPAVVGLIIGAVYACVAHRLDLPRFYLLAAWSAALGALVALGGSGSLPEGTAYFAGMGLAVLVSGAVTLRTYLRATQPLAEVEEHGP